MRGVWIGLLVLVSCGARTGFGQDDPSEAAPSPVTHREHTDPQALTISLSGLISTSTDGLHFTPRYRLDNGVDINSFAIDDAHDVMVVFDKKHNSFHSRDSGLTWYEGGSIGDSDNVDEVRSTIWDGTQFIASYKGKDLFTYAESSPDGVTWSPYAEWLNAEWVHPFRTAAGLRAVFLGGVPSWPRLGDYAYRRIAPTELLPGTNPADPFPEKWSDVQFVFEQQTTYLSTYLEGVNQLWSTKDGVTWREEPNPANVETGLTTGYYIPTASGLRFVMPVAKMMTPAISNDGRVYAIQLEPRWSTGVSYDSGKTWAWSDTVSVSGGDEPEYIFYVGK